MYAFIYIYVFSFPQEAYHATIDSDFIFYVLNFY